MSAASVTHDAAIASGPTMVAVVGDELAACARATAILESAGLSCQVATGAAEQAPGTVVVLVATGPAVDRVRAVQDLVQARPDLLIIVVMPSDGANAPLRRALQAGAAGIVADAVLERVLPATVEAVAAGQLTVPRSLGAQIAPRALSHREKQILGLVAVGCTNREIAGRLFIAESTVKTHLSSAFGKLDATSRAEATARLLDPDGPYRIAMPEVDEQGAPGVPAAARKIGSGQGV